MFDMIMEVKISSDDLRVVEWIMNGSQSEEYPEHLTTGAV